MPAARLFCAEALDQQFDFLADGDHQVGQFVDDHHDLRQHLVIELVFLIDSSPVSGSKPIWMRRPSGLPLAWRRGPFR
jgi:hypothetical protein